VSGEFAVHFRDAFTGRFARIEDSKSMQSDRQILQGGERTGSPVFANAAMIFAIGGVARQVQLVFDAPVSPVECEQAMFVCLFRRQTGDPADGFGGCSPTFGAGAPHLKDLRCKGEVDACCADRLSDDASGCDPPVGFFIGAVG